MRSSSTAYDIGFDLSELFAESTEELTSVDSSEFFEKIFPELCEV